MNLRHCKSAPMIANLDFTGYDLIKNSLTAKDWRIVFVSDQ